MCMAAPASCSSGERVVLCKAAAKTGAAPEPTQQQRREEPEPESLLQCEERRRKAGIKGGIELGAKSQAAEKRGAGGEA